MTAEFAARAEGEGCNGTRGGTPSAKLRTVFFITSENKLLSFHHYVRKVPTFRTLRSVKIHFSRVVMKNIIRNLAEGVPALVSITTLAALGS